MSLCACPEEAEILSWRRSSLKCHLQCEPSSVVVFLKSSDLLIVAALCCVLHSLRGLLTANVCPSSSSAKLGLWPNKRLTGQKTPSVESFISSDQRSHFVLLIVPPLNVVFAWQSSWTDGIHESNRAQNVNLFFVFRLRSLAILTECYCLCRCRRQYSKDLIYLWWASSSTRDQRYSKKWKAHFVVFG